MRLYLDHAATSPLCPEAREAMLPWLSEGYGNPSSMHEAGREARAAIDEAREIVAGALGCLFGEVVFTSSGTEAANLAIVGAALNYRAYGRKRVLMGAVEHHCVLRTQETLDALGYRVEFIPVDREGRVRLDALEGMLGQDVLLVSVMHANNEIGTIQQVEQIANLAHACGALFHCDAVQTFCNLPIGLPPAPAVTTHRPPTQAPNHPITQSPLPTAFADLVNISAHKLNGPKGVGALYVKAGVKLQPIIRGGGQERELRAGTENVAGIVGFGAAVKAASNGSDRAAAKRRARDAFLERLSELTSLPYVATVPSRDVALPGHAHIRFPGIGAESLLMVLDMLGVCAGAGAACSSGSLEPSHVLLACGYSQEEAKEGVRFTFGHASTVAEAEDAAGRVAQAVKQITRKSTL